MKKDPIAKEIEKALKPYLFALRDQSKAGNETLAKILASTENPPEQKHITNVHEAVIISEKGEPGTNGTTPEKGVDYFTEKEVSDIVTRARPVSGKDYFTPAEARAFLAKVTPVKGKDFFDGKTPVKGKDYFTDAEITRIMRSVTPKKGKDYFTKKEIEEIAKTASEYVEVDPKELSGEQVRNKLEALTGSARLSASAVKGIDVMIAAAVSGNTTSSGGYAPGGGAGTSPANSALWGQISGALSDQTDLQTALNAKLNYRTFGTAADSAATDFDVAGAAAAVTPTTLGLVIGTNVLAYRTFGTAANNATGDFATAAQGALAASALQSLTGAAILAGITGGQTLKGGTAVTDILKLQGTTGNGTLTSPAIQALVGNAGATTALTILNNGNVGIGTASPGYKLDVTGNIVNSSPSQGWIGLTGDLPGYAVSTYPTLKSSAIAIWLSVNNHFTGAIRDDGQFHLYTNVGVNQNVQLSANGSTYFNGGNVGIGTTAPNGKLDVQGETNQHIVLGGTVSLGSSATIASINDAGNANIPMEFRGTTFGFYDAGVPRVTFLTGGNVGIGTTGPGTKLEISNQAVFNTTTPGTGLYGLHFSGQATADYANGITWNGGSAGAQAGIYVQGSGSYGTKMYFGTTDSYAVGTKTRMMIDSGGAVGIGTTSPTGKLDVNDDHIRVRTAKTPATSGAAGNAGDIAWDANYVYVCTATNTWVRAALATW